MWKVKFSLIIDFQRFFLAKKLDGIAFSKENKCHMSIPLNINDSDIDAQAIEIFSTDRIRCVATKEKIAKRVEELSEIERAAFIEKIIDDIAAYVPGSAVSVGDLKTYHDPLTQEEVPLPRKISFCYKSKTEVIEVPGGGRFSLFKLSSFKVICKKPLSQRKRDEFNAMFDRMFADW
ncbi:MAG: hypothetical protein LBI77_04260 [Puniceicoccales bacterium]|nr:hypothetical protein [Puniceicoccales bacterium]